VPPEKPVTTTVVPLSQLQEPFVIAAGAIRPCAVPIRTVVTSVSGLISLSAPSMQRNSLFTLSNYSNQARTGKTEQINELLGSILDFLTRGG
jgi:hypothetical protein